MIHDLAFLMLIFASGPQAEDVNSDVKDAVDRIVAGRSVDERSLAMRSLFEGLSSLDADKRREVSDDSVKKMSAVLEMDGNVGRFYGAKMLGLLGCRAHGSLPELRAAQAKAGEIESDFGDLMIAPSVSAREEIDIAIVDVGGDAGCMGK